jgi:hypothetical protein
MAVRFLRLAPRGWIDRLINYMRTLVILASALLIGCSGNPMSELEEAAEKLNNAGFECGLDVHEMEFVESENCVKFASLYWRYMSAREKADNSLLSAVMTAEFSRIENRALNAQVMYSWALTGQGFNDTRAFRNFYDPDFVKNLHRLSNKSYRKRKPSYKL